MRRFPLVAMVLILPVCILRAQTASTSLPPLENIIRRTLERAAVEDENDRQFNQLYHYWRTRSTEFRDSKGQLISREEKKTEEGFGAKKNGGKPAPAPVAASKNEALSESHSNVHGQALRVKDYSLTNLVSRFRFTLVGQDTVNGRPTAILDFKPAPGKLPVHSYKDYFINKAAGRVWVDLEDYAVARADLHLTERIGILGGLAGAIWKFTYSFTRERTPEGLWFSRNVDWHLEGREVIFNRIVDYHEKKTGEQKVLSAMR